MARWKATNASPAGPPPSTEFGFRCEAEPDGIVYVAYPRCNLVAAVETSTGNVLAGGSLVLAANAILVTGDRPPRN